MRILDFMGTLKSKMYYLKVSFKITLATVDWMGARAEAGGPVRRLPSKPVELGPGQRPRGQLDRCGAVWTCLGD